MWAGGEGLVKGTGLELGCLPFRVSCLGGVGFPSRRH